MGWLSAIIRGLGSVFLDWWKGKQAQEDHDARKAEEGFIAGQRQAQIAENEIAQDAENARRDAPPDFTALR